MHKLAQFTIDAHGGLERWNDLTTASAVIRCGGVLWPLKGFPEFVEPGRVSISIHEQKHRHQPFLKSGQISSFTPGRVAIQTHNSEVLRERKNPRAAFAGHTMETPWDALHLAYFAGYAMWTYLTVPFSFILPGVKLEEIENWAENGETWRRLKVTFPDTIATHCAEQIFYIGSDGLFRRHDYEVDVAKGARGAHYVFDYKPFNGIMVPTRRRVYAPGPDNSPLPEPLIVSIDLTDVAFK